MGYRAYLHFADGKPLSADDICLGKLFGYVPDEHITELETLPMVAYALQYGMKYKGKEIMGWCTPREFWNMDDLIDPEINVFKECIADICDTRNELTLILPYYMLVPFLIAYYNDQQRFYIQSENKTYLSYSNMAEAIQTLLLRYSDLSSHLHSPEAEKADEFILYWL